MGLNKSSLTLLMVLAMAALTHARTDLFRPSFFRQFDNKKGVSSSLECCDTCECLEGYADYCFCSDMFTDKCGAGCNHCICTRKQVPAVCQCLDTLKACPTKCASKEAHDHDYGQFQSIDHIALKKD